MTDVWKVDNKTATESGPNYNPIFFRNLNVDNEIDVASGTVLLVLAAEEMHRRKLKNHVEYINGKRPELPDNLSSKIDFYL